MYRLLPILKDTYITDKQVAGSGSVTSNVGQAGSLDLFKIWSQVRSGSTPVIENSRLLVQADLSDIRALTSSLVTISDSSFKCFLSLKDIYGGQTTPSNFTLVLNPLSKSWDEGRGSDIRAFRDLDAVNWVTASVTGGSASPWAVTGAGGAGSDYLTTYEVQQTFLRGDEDLLMDVTSIVSATLAGVIADNGWRITYSASLETDTNSYFVKRFGSRHTTNSALHPKLLFTFSEAQGDSGNEAVFGQTNTIRTYHSVNGAYTNFVSGSTPVTGSASLKLLLIASKSVQISTSSYQSNFSASITYTTSSVISFSSSFPSSQSLYGNLPQTGFYQAIVLMNPQTDSALATFLGSSKKATFQSFWTSLDGTVLYSSGAYLNFSLPQSSEMVVAERNFILNVTNLKNEYIQAQTTRLRVFVQDRNTELPALRTPTPAKSLILSNMVWRLVNAFTREVVIPFHSTATKLSSDGVGMYFDLYLSDLGTQVVYELEFQITENSRDYFISNEGFRFKVVP